MIKTVKARKAVEQNVVIRLLPELKQLNCQNLCLFCNILMMPGKKYKAVIAIYIYESKSSLLLLLENGIIMLWLRV